MKVQKAALLIVLGVLTLFGVILIGFDQKGQFDTRGGDENIEILNTWNLPEILDEVSGIAYLGDKKIAAIQDENGIIFIYNLETSTIEKEIPFGKDDDYEGIAIAGSTAYVLSSNGNISRVEHFLTGNPVTTIHKNPLKGRFNFEGLSYDRENNRLLVALKEKSGRDFTPVYAFELNTNTFQEEPLFKLHFDDAVLSGINEKKAQNKLRPSEINIHPQTGKIYVLEGVNPKLLILDKNGKMERVYILNRGQFPQAEGLTFSPSGAVYVSNEGRGGKANILEVKLD
ncbi:hypothetical protein BH23BAC2_BH23BAC2_09750 [soil metagenome]